MLVLLRLVPLHQHLILVYAAIGPLVLDGSLQRVPVHLDQLLFVLWVWSLVLKSLLLAVERSFLNVDLLQVLDVFLYAEGSFAHIVAVYIVEGNLFVILGELETVLC